MRKINKIFCLMAVASLAGLASCQVEEKFTPGEADNENCEGVYFPKQEKIEEVLVFDPTQDKLDTILVRRTNEEGALTVTPKLSMSYLDAKGNPVAADTVLFNVQDAEFEDGQVESYFAIAFPDVEEGVQYMLHLSIEGDQYSSKYSSALKAADYKVMCVKYLDFVSPADSTKPAKVTFTQDWWGEVHTGYIKYYEVAGVRYCTTYGEETAATEAEKPTWSFDGGFWGTGEDYHFEFLWFVEDIDECSEGDGKHTCTVADDSGLPIGSQLLSPSVNYIGYNASSGPAAFYDYYQYLTVFQGYARPYVHWVHANSAWDKASYYDGNGGFYFASEYYVSDAGGGWYGMQGMDIVGIAEGFVREDFSVELTAGITQADSDGNNVVPVDFKLGTNVEKVGYTVLEGSLSGAQVTAEAAAIAKDTINYKYATYVDAEGVSFSDNLSCPATGVYTLVAVGFDGKKKARTTASVTFEYLLTGETNPVILNVAAGSTAKYASKGYSSISSIEYTISGAGITGAVPMIFTEAQITGFGGIDAVLDIISGEPNEYYAMLSDKDSQDYVLSAKALADVNEGGYVDIETGLKANTLYYVVVWATNGYDYTVKYATQATDGLPNEVIVDGKGYYDYQLLDETDDVTYDGLNLEYNPNTGLYEIPGWGAGGSVVFTFGVDGKDISVPLQSTGYSSYVLGDYSQIDTFFGEGTADYFVDTYGLDLTPRGYIDDDGNYNFILFYASTSGSLWLADEVFYPDGAPAADPVPIVKKKSVVISGSSPEKVINGNFITPAGVKGLEPAAHERVAATHNIGKGTSVKSAKGKGEAPVMLKNRF